jgi:hypothetical protein
MDKEAILNELRRNRMSGVGTPTASYGTERSPEATKILEELRRIRMSGQDTRTTTYGATDSSPKMSFNEYISKSEQSRQQRQKEEMERKEFEDSGILKSLARPFTDTGKRAITALAMGGEAINDIRKEGYKGLAKPSRVKDWMPESLYYDTDATWQEGGTKEIKKAVGQGAQMVAWSAPTATAAGLFMGGRKLEEGGTVGQAGLHALGGAIAVPLINQYIGKPLLNAIGKTIGVITAPIASRLEKTQGYKYLVDKATGGLKMIADKASQAGLKSGQPEWVEKIESVVGYPSRAVISGVDYTKGLIKKGAEGFVDWSAKRTLSENEILQIKKNPKEFIAGLKNKVESSDLERVLKESLNTAKAEQQEAIQKALDYARKGPHTPIPEKTVRPQTADIFGNKKQGPHEDMFTAKVPKDETSSSIILSKNGKVSIKRPANVNFKTTVDNFINPKTGLKYPEIQGNVSETEISAIKKFVKTYSTKKSYKAEELMAMKEDLMRLGDITKPNTLGKKIVDKLNASFKTIINKDDVFADAVASASREITSGKNLTKILSKYTETDGTMKKDALEKILRLKPNSEDYKIINEAFKKQIKTVAEKIKDKTEEQIFLMGEKILPFEKLSLKDSIQITNAISTFGSKVDGKIALQLKQALEFGGKGAFSSLFMPFTYQTAGTIGTAAGWLLGNPERIAMLLTKGGGFTPSFAEGLAMRIYNKVATTGDYVLLGKSLGLIEKPALFSILTGVDSL